MFAVVTVIGVFVGALNLVIVGRILILRWGWIGLIPQAPLIATLIAWAPRVDGSYIAAHWIAAAAGFVAAACLRDRWLIPVRTTGAVDVNQ
jgi:hypothetical protein